MECKKCFADMVPIIPGGGSYPLGGYSMSYRNFKKLLVDTSQYNEVKQSLKDWFGFEVSFDGEDLLVFNDRGEAIDLLWLHLKVQADEEKKRRAYNFLHTAWR